MALEWKKSLETGVDWQDAQHKELFLRINRLVEAMMQRKGKDELANLIKFLDSYVITHFGAEEQMMSKLQFKGRASHMIEHSTFKKQVSDIKKEVESGANLAVVIETQRKSVEWLTNHIGIVDKELGRFIIEKGASTGKIA
ncbi:MAG: hemerythrin family protein [Deltaproteobacteria bacterium]|nr:hemerythrin family protein [Deltaproteobacteria bacterium]